MAKTYKTATGARDPSGRDLVFEAWFEDNIARVEGGRLEQRSIYKAYRQFQRGDRALGEQGVERMLNQLKVQRQVRQGKTYRLGVGFKADVASAAGMRIGAHNDTTMLGEDATPKPDAGGGGRASGMDLLQAAWFRAAARISDEILTERVRQVEEEGFDAPHDDSRDPGAHERAAACYAYAAAQPDRLAPFVETSAKQPREGRLGWIVRETIILMWPWATQWWKPHTEAPNWKRRCMVKAAALLLAAIERHDREAARQALADSQASQMTGV